MPFNQDLNIDSFLKDMKEFLFSIKKTPNPQLTTEKIDSKLPLHSGYQVPIKSSYYNSGGFDPTGKGSVGRVHQGLDLRASGGTSLFPIATGVVTKVQTDPKGGNTVNIKHSNNVTSYYAHMGTISVHVNDVVNLDTVIGTVGASGNAKGFPHLHLQIWKNGSLVDPATVISVPKYTEFDSKNEKLWLPNAKNISDNWDMQKHLEKRKKANAISSLIALADRFESLTKIL